MTRQLLWTIFTFAGTFVTVLVMGWELIDIFEHRHDE